MYPAKKPVNLVTRRMSVTDRSLTFAVRADLIFFLKIIFVCVCGGGEVSACFSAGVAVRGPPVGVCSLHQDI